ncbi:MAG: glycosyltransferase family 9 protein [Candidatus Krumholzibacteria bacterium]|nr:glycosyltransferase family 9 protein [Candidatus Krumholzibacteria bacterium]
MRIVVIRFSSLGDCTLLCPFLEHLKNHGAEEVSVVTKRAYVELFSAARGVDRIVAIDERAGWRGLAQLIKALRPRESVIIDAHNSVRSRVLAGALGGAHARIKKYYRERLGLILFKHRRPVPAVSERYCRLGEELGFPPVPVRAGGIDVPASAAAMIGARLEGVTEDTVAVAPGARWPMKRWGEDKFGELARRLVEHYGYHLILLGDRMDVQEADRIAAPLGDRVTNLTGRTGVLGAAAAIQHSVAFIGNDSGLMHLAEAVGVPVVALFGPTVEAFGYYPSLEASKVIERDIPCRPCSRNGSRPCPKGTQECLTAIPVQPVERAFADLLHNRGPARRVVN